MKGMVYITDARVLAVPIVECDEPLIDIKLRKEISYGPAPECEWTSQDYTQIRESVFEKLCQAQKELPKGWGFRLYEGYRRLKVQKMLFEQELKRVKLQYPHESDEKHFYETTRLVSPVVHLDGSRNIPAHNTGGAVDIEIIKDDGQLLDMGMAAKDWVVVHPDLCLSECPLIDKKLQHNRKLLIELMQAYGFVNYPTEWWHFSYGDRYWAFHQPIQQAIYGSADVMLNNKGLL